MYSCKMNFSLFRKTLIFVCFYFSSGEVLCFPQNEFDYDRDYNDAIFELLQNSEKIRATMSVMTDQELDTMYGQKFTEFVEKYKKNYQNEYERQNRFRVFSENMARISLIEQLEEGTAIYGATKFADITPEEFKRQYLGFKQEGNITCTNTEEAIIPNVTVPREHDWRNFNAVTIPKDQGSCGSCYAFSTTGNVEGQYAIKHNELVSFSEQEIVDCDEYDDGCDGGEMLITYESIKKIGGLVKESDYPYKGRARECSFDSKSVIAKIEKCLNISTDEEDMAKWLYKNGPMSIALNSNWMQFYLGGIQKIQNRYCNPEGTDHAVLLTGFGERRYESEFPQPYWIIKNSWGEEWGEEGFYRMERGIGMCGVNTYVVSAVLE